nr:NUDIX domain-containing protein [Nanoarchaeota archaeon]
MELYKFDKGSFLVNLLAIIYDPKTRKILIGRRENDPHIKELSWCFPGGRPSYKEDLEFYLKHIIKIKTGLEVDVKKVVFAKTYPEKSEFLSIYYFTELIGGEEKPSRNIKELKWVKPTEVKDYFTTSLHPKVLEFLKTLE